MEDPSLQHGAPGSVQTLGSLPPELLEYIFTFLSAKDLATVSCACSLFNLVASENRLWRNCYCHVFDISMQQGLPVIAALPPPSSLGTSITADSAASDAANASASDAVPPADPSAPSSSSATSSCSAAPAAAESAESESGARTRESVVVISNVKLCFSEATHVTISRECNWRQLFAVRYLMEKKHCLTFLRRERELIKSKRRRTSRGYSSPENQAEANRGDMEKDYWIDCSVPKPMSGIKRTMEALKYIAWAEILTEAAADALHVNDIEEAQKLLLVAGEEFHSGYSLLPANHSRMPNTVRDWAKVLNKRIRLMKEKEQKARGAGAELEEHEMSPDTQQQLSHLYEKLNEIYESCLRINSSNFDPGERARMYWAYGNSLLVQAQRCISRKQQTIINPQREQELVEKALLSFDKAIEADISDELEEHEIASGVRNCVHSIMNYNAWRDKSLPSPTYDNLILQLWEECHKRLKRVLWVYLDLFEAKDKDIGTGVCQPSEVLPDNNSKFYIGEFDLECFVEWASIVYTHSTRFNRPQTIDRAIKGITLARTILQHALEEIEGHDDREWEGIIKGNLGLTYLRLAKLASDEQTKEESFRFAELYFRESEGHNDDSLYNLASLYALRGRKAECEACLRSCLEANNLRVAELMEDDDLAVIRNEEWFPQLIKDAAAREEELRRTIAEEKWKRRKHIDEWGLTSDEEEDPTEDGNAEDDPSDGAQDQGDMDVEAGP